MTDNAKRVLIFRTGSLGDTVVALPCFHLIARAFPHAERRLLTSLPIHPKAVAPSAILENTGLVHGCLNYDPKKWGITEALGLRGAIQAWAPEVLIYLAEPRGVFGTWRDVLFFKSCGIPTLIGVPSTRDLRENRWLPEKNVFEHESERLLRCLEGLGRMDLREPASWDLRLTREEETKAFQCLDSWEGKKRFIVCHVAAKVRRKDWGLENWGKLFSRLSQASPDWGVVLVGSRMETKTGESMAPAWKGSLLNLTGQLTIRETAAVMKRASFYLGHDSGPMHLAASLGIPSVAIFIDPAKPGVWFPFGSGHRVVCHGLNGKNAAPVTVDEVFETVQHALGEKHPSHA